MAPVGCGWSWVYVLAINVYYGGWGSGVAQINGPGDYVAGNSGCGSYIEKEMDIWGSLHTSWYGI